LVHSLVRNAPHFCCQHPGLVSHLLRWSGSRLQHDSSNNRVHPDVTELEPPLPERDGTRSGSAYGLRHSPIDSLGVYPGTAPYLSWLRFQRLLPRCESEHGNTRTKSLSTAALRRWQDESICSGSCILRLARRRVALPRSILSALYLSTFFRGSHETSRPPHFRLRFHSLEDHLHTFACRSYSFLAQHWRHAH